MSRKISCMDKLMGEGGRCVRVAQRLDCKMNVGRWNFREDCSQLYIRSECEHVQVLPQLCASRRRYKLILRQALAFA